MQEQLFESLVDAIKELAEAIGSLPDTNTDLIVSKNADNQIVPTEKAELVTPTADAITHVDVIPLVRQLSHISRTKTKKIVLKYGDRASEVPVDLLPAFKADLEKAIAEA